MHFVDSIDRTYFPDMDGSFSIYIRVRIYIVLTTDSHFSITMVYTRPPSCNFVLLYTM